MVYKRYIKKKGKVYGPYIYESKRVGDKVISTYLGEPKKIDKHKSLILIITFCLIVFGVLLMFFLEYSLTGKFTLQISPTYRTGESVNGLFKIGLKKGELLPIDSRIIIEQEGIIKEIPLSQFVNPNSYGNFYLENTDISGSGKGYGFSEEKIVYPNVFFKLEIYSEREEELVEQPEQTTETPSVGVIEEPSAEETEEPSVEETPAITTETPTTLETPVESPISENSDSLITGSVINELEQEIKGSCSKNNSFIYQLEQGESARLKTGSVEIEAVDENEVVKITKIDDNSVKLQIIDNKLEVTTDYSIIEKNFGREFLQDEQNFLEINLKDLNVKAKQGILKISLVYQDKVLVQIIEEINVEQLPEGNISEEENIIEVGEISFGNLTLLNETITNLTWLNFTQINMTTNFSNISVITTQEQAVIGKPVKWKKHIELEEPEKIKIKLPEEAENIIVKKIIREENDKTEELGGLEEEEKFIPEETEEVLGEDTAFTILTGKVTAELELEKQNVFIKIWKALIKNIKTITGFAVKNQIINEDDVNGNIELILEKNATEYEISYETSAPESFEQEIEKGKRIIITGPDDLEYKDVLAFTELPYEFKADVIKLYHVINETINGTGIISRQEVNITKYDLNNNSLIDYIEWVVPHLSNQTYELEINVINVKSYPQVGKEWIVMFNTTGKADLKITAFNKTNWSNTNEEHDLKFLEIKCGERVIEYEWIDNGPDNSSVFIKDYECNETGFEVSKVLTTGFHNLEFDFGGIKAYAYNTAGNLNLRIYGSTSVNYNVSTYLKVLSQADAGFDAYDMEVINPPNNYSEFYSNISSGGTEYHLAIDSWNGTSPPRTLYLIYNFDATAGAQTGTINFSWAGFIDTNFTGNFTYYRGDANYANPVGSVDMRTNSAYADSITSNSTFYIKVIISDYTFPKISFIPPTPDNQTSTTNTNISINISILDENLQEVTYNWNGTNYTIYNDSLVLMFNFENLSALGENTSRVVDLSRWGNNGTIFGATLDTTGKYGNSYKFDGANDYIRIEDNNILDFGTSSFSYSFWFNNSLSGTQDILCKQNGTASETTAGYRILVSSAIATGFSAVFANGTNNTRLDSGAHSCWNASKWCFMTVVVDRTNNFTSMYLNGTYLTGKSIPATGSVANAFNLTLGAVRDGSTRYFNGSIDEVRMWNRSLSASEINQLYMSNLQKYSSTQWYLYVNQTNSSITGLEVGSYTYFASAKDTLGYENLTEKRTITIGVAADSTPPAITIISPANATYTSLSALPTHFNISSNENLSYCKFTINNWENNYTMTLNSSLRGANFTNSSMNDGSHTVIFWCNDTTNNINNTVNITFTTNVVPSVVALLAPATGNTTTNRTPTFTWSAGSDSGGGPSALKYEINITCWEAGIIVTTGSVYKDINTIVSNTSYTASPYLKCLSDNNQYYNWTVRSYDGINYSAWNTTERNISIQSLITISLPVNSTNFGSMNLSETNDTTDNAPPPLVLRNDGNTELNITINFTHLWTSVTNPSRYFQFKIRNLTDNCFVYDKTNTSWINATAPGVTSYVINRLNFTSGYQTKCNNASIDINVTVPSGESISSANEPRSSVITITSYLGEPKQT